MKWLIYGLLLANLAFFVWHYQPNKARYRYTGDHLMRLVLLKEYEQQRQQEGAALGVGRCYSIGPFLQKESFIKAREALQQQQIEVFSRISSERVQDGYWVMLPVAESTNQARVQMQKLKEHGVKDFFLVATGEEKNAISLGVFSKPQLAKRRKDEVEGQEFRVDIKKITLPKRTYWLEWALTSDRQPDRRFLEGLLQQYEGLGQTERPCLDPKNS